MSDFGVLREILRAQDEFRGDILLKQNFGQAEVFSAEKRTQP